MYVDIDSLDDIEFSYLRGINKIILDTKYNPNDIKFKQRDFFEYKYLEIITHYLFYIEEILKRIRPTHILRINCSNLNEN